MPGKINHLSPHHKGIMPIRVLQYNIIHAFEHMNPDFLALAQRVIKQHNANPAIGYLIEEKPVQSPYVIFNTINVSESFLSYVWCNCYSLLVLYHEVIAKLSFNAYHGREETVVDKHLAVGAYKLWQYAVSLIHNYTPWDTNLPNPELVEISTEDITEKANALFEVAMSFILAHEFAHIELQHNDSNQDFERAADERAMELVLQGANDDNRLTRTIGILMGLCSLLFFKATMRSDNYPDMDDRIDAIIAKVNPHPQHGMWDIATLAYKLWDRLHGIGLAWTEGLESPKALYHDIKRQVKEREANRL